MIAFVVSFVSPHTLPLGRELAKYQDVVFINTMPLTEERKRMGYDVGDEKVNICSYNDDPVKCQKIIDTSECVIYAGSFGFNMLKNRLKKDKLTLIMHERIFKKGVIKLLDPRTWELLDFCHRVQSKNVYFLSIGKNAAKDFILLGFNKNKILNFGYFPDVTYGQIISKKLNNDTCKILWVGRMVDFKKPILALKALRKLPPKYVLTMIGDGKLYDKAVKYAEKHNICVRFLGNVAHDEVVDCMRSSHILLSTSNKGEGWGAVINEGMNSGCAIVCSDQIGCYGTLADDANSVAFRSGSVESIVQAIITADARKEELSRKSIHTVVNEYNPSIAAERLIAFIEGGKIADSGVCSRFFE
ncbi:MAG: glycosyltransferase [Ruminococcaceae bacterium]|nr:glycosyltransferase [Oscillospiraceae bacterium]